MVLRGRLGRLTLAMALAAVAMVPLAAWASTPYNDTVSGHESSATSTTGNFYGTATGDLPGNWTATVNHAPLVGYPTYTTPIYSGGSFALTPSVGAKVSGSFTGGTVVQTSGFAWCSSTQTYLVTGGLAITAPNAGTGQFGPATLTHHNFKFFGTCITYAAEVSGSVSLTY